MSKDLMSAIEEFINKNKDKDKSLEMMYNGNIIHNKIQSIQKKAVLYNEPEYVCIAFEEIIKTLEEVEKKLNK